MKERFRFFLKTDVRYGVDEFLKLPDYLESRKFNKVVLFIDGALKKLRNVKKVIKSCEGRFKTTVFYYDIGEEPSYEYLDEIAGVFRKKKGVEVLVGIGGGSTIDFAKGIAVLMTNKGPAINYRGFPEDINEPLPVVAVPTTAGTGTETTYNAVFVSKKENKKLGINTTKNFPIFSILDPGLIKSCPLSVIASSGMDALTHALEAFVSTETQPLSRAVAKEAIRLLSTNLLAVAKGNTSLDVLGNLQMGAYLAIIGLFNSSSGPAGSLSYPLGAWFRVPHGLATAIYLPLVHQCNWKKGYYEYAELADMIYGYSGSNRKTKAGKFIDLLFELGDRLGVPKKFKQLRLKPEDIKRLEDDALEKARSGRFAFNPVTLTESDILSIFSQLKI